MLLPLSSFTPDANPEEEGCKDMSGFVPTSSLGYGTAPVKVDFGYPALAAECTGAASVVDLRGNYALYAGTFSKLYKWNGVSWIDFSGSAYSAGVDWYFTGYGDHVVTADGSDRLQYVAAQGGVAFADIANSPKAAIVEQVGYHLMAFNDGSDSIDGWYSSKLGDDLTWSYTQADNSAKGRLLATQGPIVAGKALGDRIVAYKDTGIYIGTFVGPPTVWAWQLASPGFGALGKFAVTTIDLGGSPVHFVVGSRDIFLFDGNVARPIGRGIIRDWFYGRLSNNAVYTQRTRAIVDPINTLVYVLFPTQSSTGELNDCLVWNYSTDKWGVGRNYSARVGLQFITPGRTFDTWPSGGTFDSLSAFDFDSMGTGFGIISPGIVGTDKILYAVNGVPDSSVASYYKTQMYGDDEGVSLVSRIRPRFNNAPTTATLQHFTADTLNGATVSQTATFGSRRFDVLAEARWHQDLVTVYGPTLLNAQDVMIEVTADE